MSEPQAMTEPREAQFRHWVERCINGEVKQQVLNDRFWNDLRDLALDWQEARAARHLPSQDPRWTVGYWQDSADREFWNILRVPDDKFSSASQNPTEAEVRAAVEKLNAPAPDADRVAKLEKVVEAARASHKCGGRVASCGNVRLCNALHVLDHGPAALSDHDSGKEEADRA